MKPRQLSLRLGDPGPKRPPAKAAWPCRFCGAVTGRDRWDCDVCRQPRRDRRGASFVAPGPLRDDPIPF